MYISVLSRVTYAGAIEKMERMESSSCTSESKDFPLSHWRRRRRIIILILEVIWRCNWAREKDGARRGRRSRRRRRWWEEGQWDSWARVQREKRRPEGWRCEKWRRGRSC